MFVSDLLQFYWSCLRMTLKACEGTKIQPSTQTFFLQYFSFEKKNPNPNPTHISGPLQAIFLRRAPLLFDFVSQLKDQFFASLSGQTAPFSYSPATTITHKYLSLINFCFGLPGWRQRGVTPPQFSTRSGFSFCYLCSGRCRCGCSGVSKARWWEDASATGPSLHAAEF